MRNEGRTVGVLKTEFPEGFGDTYSTDDVDFFRKCIQILSKYAGDIEAFINGSWFQRKERDREVMNAAMTLGMIEQVRFSRSSESMRPRRKVK